MIGLGVGVDYALFIVTRFRENYRSNGGNVAQAVEAAINTSGRAVLFAGVTVVIALLGMFALGVSLLSGAAVAASIGVVLVLAASLTLLPALLSLIGRRVGEAGGRPRSSPTRARGRPAERRRFLAALGPARAAAPRDHRGGGDGAHAGPRRSRPRTPSRLQRRGQRPGQPDDPSGVRSPGQGIRARLQRPPPVGGGAPAGPRHGRADLVEPGREEHPGRGVRDTARAQPGRDRGRRGRLPGDLAPERADLESGHASA